MNKKEKEAIELLESFEPDDLIECAIYRNALETILNLIDKQQKEIDKQNKVIDEMARTIIKERGYKNIDEHPEWIENTKRFFFKKVENDERREKILRRVEEDGKN